MKIDPCNFELYRFKVWSLRHSVEIGLIDLLID